MRTSSRKTTAAVLRDIIGIKVPEWAEILNRSPHSVNALETGRLKLSEGLAMQMHYETGISIKWLLDGKPKASPIAEFGEKFTKANFEKVQARKKYFARVKETNLKIDAIEFLRRICNVLVSANRKRCYHLTAYWIGKALDGWSAQLGEPRDFNNYEKLRTYLLPMWLRKEPGLPLVPPSEHARNIQEALCKLDQTAAFKPKSKRPSKKRRRR